MVEYKQIFCIVSSPFTVTFLSSFNLTNNRHCAAEINYILEYGNAPKLIDLLCRRIEAQWMIWHHKQPQLTEAVTAVMATYYSWSEERKAAKIEASLAYVKNNVRFLK